MSDYKLKPCPFCGGEATFSGYYMDGNASHHYAMCGCAKCDIFFYAKPPNAYYSYEFGEQKHIDEANRIVIEAWNRRVDNG